MADPVHHGPNAPVPSSSNAIRDRLSASNTDDKIESKPSTTTFSAATQMLIARARGQANAIGGGIASATTVALPANYEEMKRRVMEGMKTSMNMELPPLASPGKRNTGVRFPGALKRESMRAASVARSGVDLQTGVQKTATTSTSTATVSTSTLSSGVKQEKMAAKIGSAKKGHKRKRTMDEESSTGDDSGAMSDLGGDSESDGSDNTPDFPAMTQSGRVVVKPSHFNPAISEASPRKRHLTRRMLGKNAEQALCKRCGRGHSPASNMIVFCDGCNAPYHQMCHDPLVSDETVQDEAEDWFCGECEAKISKVHIPRTTIPATTRPPPEINRTSGWVGKSADEKRAHLLAMPQAHLVSLLLYATTIHPDIPIPPAPLIQSQSQPQPQTASQTQTYPSHHHQHQQPPSSRRSTIIYPQQPFPPSATSTAGLFTRAEANPTAPINFIRKIQANGSGSTSSFAKPFKHATSPTTSASPTGISLNFNHASQNMVASISKPSSTPCNADININTTSTKIGSKPITSGSAVLLVSSGSSTLPGPAPQNLLQPQPTVLTQPKAVILPQQKDVLKDEEAFLHSISRESTPASPPYPRPGNGLMAKLPPDHEDLEWLVGDGEDSIVFSHTVFERDSSAKVDGI